MPSGTNTAALASGSVDQVEENNRHFFAAFFRIKSQTIAPAAESSMIASDDQAGEPVMHTIIPIEDQIEPLSTTIATNHLLQHVKNDIFRYRVAGGIFTVAGVSVLGAATYLVATFALATAVGGPVGLAVAAGVVGAVVVLSLITIATIAFMKSREAKKNERILTQNLKGKGPLVISHQETALSREASFKLAQQEIARLTQENAALRKSLNETFDELARTRAMGEAINDELPKARQLRETIEEYELRIRALKDQIDLMRQEYDRAVKFPSRK